MFNKGDKFKVITTQPVCIYTQNMNFQSNCYDLELQKELDINDITDDYCLDIVDNAGSLSVYIPKGMPCTVTCNVPKEYSIIFKNIECELEIEDITFEEIFNVTEEV